MKNPDPLFLHLLYLVFEHTLDFIAHGASFSGLRPPGQAKFSRSYGPQGLLLPLLWYRRFLPGSSSRQKGGSTPF